MKIIKLFFKIGLAAIIIVWLVRSGRLDVGEIPKAAITKQTVLGILVLLGIFNLLQVLRWWLLLSLQGLNISLARCFNITMISQFLSVVLPGSLGLDALRTYYIVKEFPGSKLLGSITVLMDRLLGFLTIFSVGSVSLAIVYFSGIIDRVVVWQVGWLLVIVTSLLLLLLPLFVLPMGRRLISGLSPVGLSSFCDQTLKNIRSKPWLSLGSVFVSCFAVAFFLLAFWRVGVTLYNGIQWYQVAIVVPLVVLSNLLPLTPGGIGVGEAASSFFFSMFGIACGAEIMLIMRLYAFLMRLPGAVIYLFPQSVVSNKRYRE